jgi:hypothetical protein
MVSRLLETNVHVYRCIPSSYLTLFNAVRGVITGPFYIISYGGRLLQKFECSWPVGHLENLTAVYKRMAKVSDVIRYNAHENDLTNKRRYDKSTNERIFQVGDLVLYF